MINIKKDIRNILREFEDNLKEDYNCGFERNRKKKLAAFSLAEIKIKDLFERNP